MHKILLAIASLILAVGVLFIAFTYYENSKIDAARLKLEVYTEMGIKDYNMNTGGRRNGNGVGIEYNFSPHPKDLEDLILGSK